MEDPVPHTTQDDAEAERRRRAAEEAMEQMLLAQEGEENSNDEDVFLPNDNEDYHEQQQQQQQQQPEQEDPFVPLNRNIMEETANERKKPFTYIQTSFLAAFALVYYALRSRQQWYLALVFLSSSKWAYIVLGNALIAFLIWMFKAFTSVFLNGLRLAEAEGIGDFFRWNITETCIALTIFRSELNVKTMILFLILVLAKCLHWVTDTREGHLRMTEEAIATHQVNQWPVIRWPHFKLLLCLGSLQLLDILAVIHCAQHIIQNGHSVYILFAFEGTILLVSVVSNILLWHIHLMDGLLHHWHETLESSRIRHRWIHPWRDHKATLVFAVEVQTQATKFVFYVTFFAIVMTYYGMPINLFREVYVSFQSLKQRLVAFSKYRQLMANMNRFASPTPEELEEEHICIICRDEMTVETTKKLPGCGHLFHKSCLREWLVQQQSCPTCRGDIFANEARQRQQDLADERQREEQEGQEQTEDTANTPGGQEEEQQEEQKNTLEGTRDGHIDPTKGQSSREDNNPDRSGFLNNLEKCMLPASGENKVPMVPPTPNQKFDDSSKNIDDSPAFPAFYRVTKDEGASAYNDGDSISFVIRIVPFGLIVLGQGLSWRDCDDEKRLMLQIPDGWVCEDELERIVAIPFEDDDRWNNKIS
jgi:E3 ubiquitin-protein ligase synoviolin